MLIRGYMAMIVGIDPGPEKCAYVVLDRGAISNHGIMGSATMVDYAKDMTGRPCIKDLTIVCEDVACMGMRVGRDVFETCKVIGRLHQAVGDDFKMIPRPDIKHHICGHRAAKDADVRAKLIDIYGPGKAKAVGTKKAPGPLHGIKKDEWQALAVARYWLETSGT